MQKDISKEMLKSFGISSTETRIGLVLNSQNPRTVARLTTYTTRNSLVTMINSLRNPGDGNRLDKAIELVRNDLFTRPNGARNNAPKTVVIFMNKKADISSLTEAQKSKDSGVKIVVVGYGEDIDKEELRSISSGKDLTYMLTDSDDVIKRVASSVAKNTLPGMFLRNFVNARNRNSHYY